MQFKHLHFDQDDWWKQGDADESKAIQRLNEEGQWGWRLHHVVWLDGGGSVAVMSDADEEEG